MQDKLSALEAGSPYGPGLASYGRQMDELLLVCGRSAADVLWTMEEGLHCGSLAAVVGEIWENPRELGFTATKRLVRRAERSGIHAALIRWQAVPTLSAARRRWRLTSLPSATNRLDGRAAGEPVWQAELFRVQGRAPGTWTARYDRQAHRLDLAAPLPDRKMDRPAHRTAEPGPVPGDRRRAA
ncbi:MULTISPECIES: ImuA family protein [Pacificimonas]|uniref:ImuA family protein n=1 Tax=Pacificimonas TaxID=1960290 RepID=UPI001CC9DD0D|nr:MULTISPECIES: hypothetical protein [Pacificimonas]